jgi:hypothetical protein
MSVSERRRPAALVLVALAALAAGCGGQAPPPPAPPPPPPPEPRVLWPAELVADLKLPAAPEKPALDPAQVDTFVALERRLRGDLASAGAERREAAVREAGFKDAAGHAAFAGRLKRAFDVLQRLRVLEKMGMAGSLCRAEVVEAARKEAGELGLSEPDLRLVHEKSAGLVGLLGK